MNIKLRFENGKILACEVYENNFRKGPDVDVTKDAITSIRDYIGVNNSNEFDASGECSIKISVEQIGRNFPARY